MSSTYGDTAGHSLMPTEVQALFIGCLGLPFEEVPVDHREVTAFSKLTKRAMGEQILLCGAKWRVDAFYEDLMP